MRNGEGSRILTACEAPLLDIEAGYKLGICIDLEGDYERINYKQCMTCGVTQ